MRGITPALFISHGAPTAALQDDGYSQALAEWGRHQPRPRAIVLLSAHAEAPGPVRASGGLRPALAYDFHGFPAQLNTLRYPAPGWPELAALVASRLTAAGVEAEVDEGATWDHGLWVPLRMLFPAADVPVVALSLPLPRTPELLLRMGAALGPLRRKGLLLVGSGGLVHNLRQLAWDDPQGAPELWATEFEGWVEERVSSGDVTALEQYRQHAPHAALAAPTSEHLDPLFFVLGSRDVRDRVVTVYEGFRYGALSLRCFALVAR